jgi:hypothetical protein
MVRAGDVQGSAAGLTTRADEAGRFSFANVPPGRYRIAARSTGPIGAMSLAVSELTIDGEDLDDVVLSLQPALTISGLVVFRGDTPPPVLGKSTATPVPLTILLSGAAVTTPILVDGVRFSIEGQAPGPFRLRGGLQGARPFGGWWLQSVLANGVELLDTQLDLSQNVTGAVAVFADRASELSGRVTSEEGAAVNGTIVVAFSADRAAWFAGSRRIAGVLTDRDGRYAIRNLPPGEYRLVATSAFDPLLLEWFDPVRLEELLPAAVPVTIAGPERKTVDLRPR